MPKPKGFEHKKLPPPCPRSGQSKRLGLPAKASKTKKYRLIPSCYTDGALRRLIGRNLLGSRSVVLLGTRLSIRTSPQLASTRFSISFSHFKLFSGEKTQARAKLGLSAILPKFCKPSAPYPCPKMQLNHKG